MKLLVVGCGYLGERVGLRWLERGHQVYATTRREDRARELQEKGFVPIVADLLNKASLSRIPEVDLLLLAVARGRNATISQSELALDGTNHLLEQAESKIEKWVQISSTSVYGQESGEWIDEGSLVEPKRENGIVCLEAEHLLSRSLTPQRLMILRLAGIYGPGRVLTRIDSLKRGEPLTGNPDAWLNLIHVEDAARGIEALVEGSTWGEPLLVSDDLPVRRSDYYTELTRLSQAPPPVFERTSTELNKRCCNRRFRELLGTPLQYSDYAAGLRNSLQASPAGE